jgi:citronellol/citronellal dehydrogenase
VNTLKDKPLFITGASRGIGLAIALRAARDDDGILLARRVSGAQAATNLGG